MPAPITEADNPNSPALAAANASMRCGLILDIADWNEMAMLVLPWIFHKRISIYIFRTSCPTRNTFLSNITIKKQQPFRTGLLPPLGEPISKLRERQVLRDACPNLAHGDERAHETDCGHHCQHDLNWCHLFYSPRCFRDCMKEYMDSSCILQLKGRTRASPHCNVLQNRASLR